MSLPNSPFARQDETEESNLLDLPQAPRSHELDHVNFKRLVLKFDSKYLSETDLDVPLNFYKRFCKSSLKQAAVCYERVERLKNDITDIKERI